jgi:hypothetical protein
VLTLRAIAADEPPAPLVWSGTTTNEAAPPRVSLPTPYGAKNTGAGRMLTVTLINGLDGLVYG